MICSLCDARCCKTKVITITVFDMFRIVQRGVEVESFVELRKPDILFFDERDLLYCNVEGVEMEFLLTIKSHPCVFLKNNRCSIYEYAPLTCKSYPLNKKGDMVENPLCPFIATQLFRVKGVKYWVKEAIEKEEEEHRKIVKEWNKIRGTKKECIEFLLREAGKRRFKNIGNVIILK